MLRPLGTVALGLLVAAGAAAQDSTAPLAGTKKELQELRERQKAGGPDVTDGLRSVRSISGPSAGGGEALPPRVTPENREREQRLREKARQNWLLNGVNRLKGETGDSRSRKRDLNPAGADNEGGSAESAESIDPADPAYLLKLYDRQKKLPVDKLSGDPAERTSSRAADPLAPFLQGWLANSPVRDQALAGTPRQPADSLTSGFKMDPSRAVGPLNGNPGAGATNASPNPYLADSVTAPASAPPLSRPLDLSPPPATVPPAAPPAVASPGLASTPTPAVEPAPEARRVAPPPANDDKKYFPQLKKF